MSHCLMYLGISRTVPQTSRLPKGHWRDWKNREKFFLNLATQLGFDPNVAENWKKVTTAYVMQQEVRGKWLTRCKVIPPVLKSGRTINSYEIWKQQIGRAHV